MPPLSSVNILCFTASYAIALLFDLLRFFFGNTERFRQWATWGRALSLIFLLGGFLAQTIFLFYHRIFLSGRIIGSEQAFFFLAAWGMVAVDLHWSRRRPMAPFGLILLPLALLFIFVGSLGASSSPFSTQAVAPAIRSVHVIAFLASVLFLALGAAAALMYFEQQECLKNKRKPFLNIRLPSMEWSGTLARTTYGISLIALFLGVLFGSRLSFEVRDSRPAFPIYDPLVLWAVAMLVLWLLLTVREFRLNRTSRLEVSAPLIGFGLLALALLGSLLLRVSHWNPPAAENSQTVVVLRHCVPQKLTTLPTPKTCIVRDTQKKKSTETSTTNRENTTTVATRKETAST